MGRDRDFFLLAVFTFLTVASWIFFELIQTTKTSTVTAEVQQIITPFSPKINTDVLKKLGSRSVY